MLEQLKQEVYEANMQLPATGLVCLTWGNVSAVDRERECFIIKPSGVAYEELRPEMMVVIGFDGKKIEGNLNPSSDTETHRVLYNAFPEIGGVVHTHSTWAVAWAQAAQDLTCYGTTHADSFYGPIPCCRTLTQEEIDAGYEAATGDVIVETFRERKIDPAYVPAVLCANHGPFTWGKNAHDAVHNAFVLEQVAKMALLTKLVQPDAPAIPQRQLDKHFLRKHGENAYYGQR